jgi:tripartite-type tricarboxylate transporter receptor subunit TctC
MNTSIRINPVHRVRRLAAHALSGLMLAALPIAASAQKPYPTKPITLIVPFAAGGIADATARTVAEAMKDSLQQTVVIDNRPSAGGIIATRAVTNASPDGYTLLLMSNASAVSVSMFKKLPYDTVKDLVPISTLGYFDLGIFVPAASPFKSLQEAVQHGKANPGKLTVGTISIGSTQHLASKLFETAAGMSVLTVPYKGSGEVLTALRSGELDLAWEILGPMLPQLKAGPVKILAVTSEQRNPVLPEVPTALEAGIANYVVASWNAIAAPAGTPPDVIQALNRAINEAVASPKVRTRMESLGMRMQGSTPEQTSALLASEIKRWGDVVRDAKITAD